MLALADHGRTRGAATAKLWLVIVSDFQCPYCKHWHDETYGRIDREYVQPGRLRVAYVNFPLTSIHRWAMPAAEAAMCASVQGRFWQMQDALFASQEDWARSSNAPAMFDSLAVKTGVNATAWRKCVAEHQVRPLIENDASRATASGIQSTPTFIIGNEGIAGAQPYEAFRTVIERQLARADSAPPPAR